MLPRHPLGALAEEPPFAVLSSAFEAHGTVDMSDFEGLYVPDESLDGFVGTQVEGNVMRFGALPRSELAPVLVIDRDADELLALALWHEDVDDPGDASLIYVLYRREANGDLAVAIGGSDEALWGEPPSRLRRVESPLPGLAYRPDIASLGLPMMFATARGGRCNPAKVIPIQGRFELDIRAMALGANDFEANVRNATLHRLVGELALGEGGIWNPVLSGGHCAERVSAGSQGGFVLRFTASTFDEESVAFAAHITPTETGVAVQFASTAVPHERALTVFYRRTGEFTPVTRR